MRACLRYILLLIALPFTLLLSAQKPKKFFARAGQGGYGYAVFIGPDDVAAGSAKIKNLTTREETPLCLKN